MWMHVCVMDDVCYGEFKKVRVIPKSTSLCDHVYDIYFTVGWLIKMI